MKCNFCGIQIPKGTGIMFVKKDGTTYRFCSKKCEKNQLKLKRKSAKTRWTERAQQLKQVALKAAKDKKPSKVKAKLEPVKKAEKEEVKSEPKKEVKKTETKKAEKK